MARPAGGRMAEGHRKQKGSWAWRASPSGISACFPENPAGRLLRNRLRFYGAVSADQAGLFRADGPAFAPGRRQDARLRPLQPKKWKQIPAIGKNACAIYKRIRLIYTTHMGKNGRGSIRCRIGRAKPSPVGGERMRRRQLASNRIFIRKRN